MQSQDRVTRRHEPAHPLFRRALREDRWRRQLDTSRRQLLELMPVELHAEIEQRYDALKAEGWKRYRRGSSDMAPPRITIAGRDRWRLMDHARSLERRTRTLAKAEAQADKIKEGRAKARPKHRGALGIVAIEVLRALLFAFPHHRGLFPSLQRIADAVGKTVPTIVTAIGRLIVEGFLTKHRRCKTLKDPMFGTRQVQDSNAYELHAPTGLGPLGGSDLKNHPGTAEHLQKERKNESGDALCGALGAAIGRLGDAVRAGMPP